MQLGTVVGTATSTVKHSTLNGWKMLIVQFYGADGRTPDGEPVIAIDALGAGIGESVVLSSDGKGTRKLVGSDNTPVRWSVIGIKDLRG
jgi:ethanolamine utilization protein EutN